MHAEMVAGLTFQLRELDGLDSKAVLMLTPLGVLLGLGVVATTRSPTSTAHLVGVGEVLTIVSLGVLVLGIVLGVVAYWPRSIDAVPNPSGVYPGFLGATTPQLLGAEIEAIGRIYPRLRQVHQTKEWIATWEFGAILLGALLLTAGYGIGVLGL